MTDGATKPGILILGAPRSGTTLLRRLVNAHPAIACPGENYLFGAAARFLRRDPTLQGVSMDVVTGLAYAGFDEQEVLGRLRRLVFGFHEDYARAQGKTRWASKAAADGFYLDDVERLCGDAVRYVCLVRHGLDVCVSLQDLTNENGAYLAELHDYIRRWPRPMEAFAHAWADIAGGLKRLADRRPESALLVRYEDLVADPPATMARIFAFVGEPADADLVARAMADRDSVGLGDWRTYRTDKVEKASVERWRKLPKPAFALLAPIVNPTLLELGYDTVPEDGADTDEESRRRYELGLLIGAAWAKKDK
jgi:hypothetical protein